MNYKVTITYKSQDDILRFCDKKYDHTIIEIWSNIDSIDLKYALSEILDCFVDENKVPVYPELDQVKKNLEKYIDDKDFIQREHDRLVEAYSSYINLSSQLNKQNQAHVEIKSSKTEIDIVSLD